MNRRLLILIIAAWLSVGCDTTRRVSLGPVEAFAVGEVRTYQNDQVLLVVGGTAGDKQFRAFHAIDPWSGCPVHWSAEAQMFTDPCGGSFWGQDGGPVAGPSNERLQPLSVRVNDGQVEVAVPAITP